jgi:hypothetical protein
MSTAVNPMLAPSRQSLSLYANQELNRESLFLSSRKFPETNRNSFVPTGLRMESLTLKESTATAIYPYQDLIGKSHTECLALYSEKGYTAKEIERSIIPKPEIAIKVKLSPEKEESVPRTVYINICSSSDIPLNNRENQGVNGEEELISSSHLPYMLLNSYLPDENAQRSDYTVDVILHPDEFYLAEEEGLDGIGKSQVKDYLIYL